MYDRKLQIFVEFLNKSMNCCRPLFFCRVAMRKSFSKGKKIIILKGCDKFEVKTLFLQSKKLQKR